MAQSFQKESDQRILYWDFDNDLDEKIKMQIEILLNEIVRTIKNREGRRNRYLLPLKCLFCYTEKSGLKDIMKMEKDQEQEYYSILKREYDNICPSPKKFVLFCRKALFLESTEIDWEANVWFVERLNISPERYSRSNTIDSFSFLGSECAENRQSMQNITAQSYNNKLKVISSFLHYLRITDYITDDSYPVGVYFKKSYPVVNEINNMDKKLDLLTTHLREFPEQLRIISLILLFTGIKKGQLFLLRNADFYYYKDENSWMKVPDTIRSIPVSDILHWLVLIYADKNHISVEKLFFLNNGKKYTAESFQCAIMKGCRNAGILADEYVFKGNGYQKKLCKSFYRNRNGTSIQTIRDYMDYSTDEIVKKNIGLVDEELAKKSMEYYEKIENNLGGGC